MASLLDAGAARHLADARRAGRLARLPLDTLPDPDAAQAFQDAAVTALGLTPCGYKIGATSAEAQRLLACPEPIYAPVFTEHLLGSGDAFPLPEGVLGIECEFGFRLGRDYPGEGESATLASLRDAVAECFTALEIVGRRVGPEVPLNHVTSLADFALDIAVVRGAPIPGWDSLDLAEMPVSARLDGIEAATGTGAAVLGHPLSALLWLAEALGRRGQRLRAGDIVLTGTCTGIVGVKPGQVFEGRFADWEPVRVRLA